VNVRAALAVLLLAGPVVPASAQSARVGGRGYVTYGEVQFAAADTFKAVSGSARTASLGGGGQVTGLWRGLFVDAALSRQQVDGERVFVLNGTVYKLGIPLEVRTMPLDVAVGWRVAGRRVSPYVGGGLSSIGYTETGQFAQAGEDATARKSGALLLAGVDLPLGHYLFVGGELRYRAVTACRRRTARINLAACPTPSACPSAGEDLRWA
jgi:hypothetical protein